MVWIFIAVTHTHIHTYSLKQDLETSGQLSSQELSDTIETCMHTKTRVHTHTHTHTQSKGKLHFFENVAVFYKILMEDKDIDSFLFSV